MTNTPIIIITVFMFFACTIFPHETIGQDNNSVKTNNKSNTSNSASRKPQDLLSLVNPNLSRNIYLYKGVIEDFMNSISNTDIQSKLNIIHPKSNLYPSTSAIAEFNKNPTKHSSPIILKHIIKSVKIISETKDSAKLEYEFDLYMAMDKRSKLKKFSEKHSGTCELRLLADKWLMYEDSNVVRRKN